MGIPIRDCPGLKQTAPLVPSPSSSQAARSSTLSRINPNPISPSSSRLLSPSASQPLPLEPSIHFQPRYEVLEASPCASERSISQIEYSTDLTQLWNVKLRVLGGGGELFFAMKPSYNVYRPNGIVVLNLRSDKTSAWTDPLPSGWKDLDLKVSFSKQFIQDYMDPTTEARFSSDLEDILPREEFDAHLETCEPGKTTEICHSSTTPQGFRVKFEYKCWTDGEGSWRLEDVCLAVSGMRPVISHSTS